MGMLSGFESTVSGTLTAGERGLVRDERKGVYGFCFNGSFVRYNRQVKMELFALGNPFLPHGSSVTKTVSGVGAVVEGFNLNVELSNV